ncbi:hypothetical protein Unana1_00988 [Umbelopsis nana]
MMWEQAPREDPYIIAPCTPSSPPSSMMWEQAPREVPSTPYPTYSSMISQQTHEQASTSLVSIPSTTPVHSLFTGTYQPVYLLESDFTSEVNGIYHSYKRRKLSTSTVQDIIDHRPFDLADFDIQDFDRDLPSHIFDIDDLSLSAYLRKALEKAQEKRAEQARKRREKRDAKREEQKSLQQKKREEAGEPEPKCFSCGQEGHLRSSSKACPNYKPKLAAQFAAEG